MGLRGQSNDRLLPFICFCERDDDISTSALVYLSDDSTSSGIRHLAGISYDLPT